MIREVIYSHFVEEVPVSDRVVIDDKGREVLDDRPVSIPINIAPPPSSMSQLVHQLYMQMRADNQEVESFEDADDFDISDELGIEMESTPYEQDFDHIAENSAPSTGSYDVPSQPEKVEKVVEESA